MKVERNARLAKLYWLFLGLSLFLCVSAVPIFSQEWKSVAAGVEYAEVRREFSGKPVDIDLIRLDLRKVRLDVHHAMDAAIGLETTSSIAMRHKAIAAINAGFFRLDKSQFAGDAAGILMIDGKLLSEPVNDRIQILIDNRRDRTNILFGRTTLSLALKIGNETVDLSGINRERRKDDIVIYTPEFGRTTLTGNDGIEIVVARGRVASISMDLGNSVIPADGFVVSASGSLRQALTDAARNSTPVSIIRKWDSLPPEVAKDRSELDITNGVPLLIRNGKIDITWQQEKTNMAFVETRHPRTAVAKLQDGKFLMLTADGRSEASGGLGLQDLAEYMLELGATDAMNLDGGGSTTMFLDGKVVNKPSDKEGERKVSDAILVTLRKKK